MALYFLYRQQESSLPHNDMEIDSMGNNHNTLATPYSDIY